MIILKIVGGAEEKWGCRKKKSNSNIV